MKSWSKIFKWSISLSIISLSSIADAADKITFQLDWLPGGDKAPVYVGVEEGFFADSGLDVTIKIGKGSSDALTQLASGHAEIGYSDIVALLAAKANSQVPVQAVFSYFSKAPYAFYVTQNSGIHRVSDVANKTIVTSPFTSENIFLPLLFKKNHVPQSSVKILKADPGALNPMLITGKADVMVSWVTDKDRYEAQAKKAGKMLNILPWYDAGLEFYSSSIVANEQFIKEKPDVVKRFIAAYVKAIKFTWQHPQKSAEDVHKIVPEVDVDDAKNTIQSIKGLVYNEVSSKYGLGQFNPQRLTNTWIATAGALGIDPNDFDPESAVNRQFLPVKAQ
jgi:NitT/TauT family transport system substrate-binding protein